MKLFAYVRSIFLWTFIIIATLVAASGVLICAPFVWFFDRERHSLHNFGLLWAKAIFAVSPWGVHVKGKENLAKKGDAVVYVANHLSQADILVAYVLDTRFRWLSKESVFRIPFLGWAMRVIGYVGVNRGDRRSHERCMRELGEHLRKGTPVFFFPEGTRSRDGVLKEFKSGAFRLACQHKVPVVPITLLGTDTLLPKHSWLPNDADLEIVIHPKIESAGIDAETLARQAQATIAAALPPEKRGEIGSSLAKGVQS